MKIRQCHRCPHDGKHSKACLTCHLAELGYKGRTIVCIDNVNETTIIQPETSTDTLPDSHRMAIIREWARRRHINAKYLKIMMTFLQLRDSKSEVARELGINPRRVSEALSRIANGNARIRRAFGIVGRE